nr:hypothetical protein [Flavobacterium soli]
MKKNILKAFLMVIMLFGIQQANAQQIELNVTFNPSMCHYEVYARPDFTQNNFILAGGSQVTILLPSSVDNSSVLITNVNGGPWSDNSQVYAPAALPANDFHALSTNGSTVNFVTGVELLLFTFELPGGSCCAAGVRLFNNTTDPQSSDPGMGGGDFNNYVANALSLNDLYLGNYNNGGTICDPCLINPVAVPTTTDPTQDFCLIDAPTLADLQVNETNIRWYAAASGGTPLLNTTALVSGTTYYAAQFELIDDCESATRLAITATVGNAATPTTTDTTQDFCLIDAPTVGNIQVNEAGVIWYTAATGGSVVANASALVSGTTYYASQTIGGCPSATRLAVTVTVNNAATPTTTDTTQDFCLIDSPTVSDLQVNEAGVVWYTAATGGALIAGNTAIVSGTTYYASQTIGGCPSATRLAVTATVGNAPTPTTTDSTQDFCLIDAPTVGDIQVNETGITWYSAATGGVVVANGTALSSGTTYYASLTDAGTGCESATRLAVTVTVGNATTPTTTDTTQDFCLIDAPTVSDIQVNQAGITWYTAATGGSVVAGNTALVSGTTYYASQTLGSCQSATRLAVTVTVGNAATPTTTDTTQEFCLILNPLVSAIQVNEAGVTWYNAANGGSAVANNTPLVNGTTYYASLTDIASGCESATRLAVTVTVANATTPTTTDTTQDFCLVDNPTVNDIQVNEAGIVWFTAATGGSVVAGNTALVSGTTYYASQTIGECESATRLAVTVTVGNAATPTTDNPTQQFCSYNNPTLNSIDVNEAGVIWYAAATGGTALAANTPLVNGTTYYGVLVNQGCESATRLAVTVNLSNLCDVTLNLKAMLQGALYGTSNGLMRDNLRTLDLIPLNQPYSSALNMRFTHVNGGGAETTTSAVLSVSGGAAIVDWVFLEFREVAAPHSVFKTASALLRRDGTIVAGDGGALVISNLPENFLVAIKHRNHFGTMIAEAVTVENNTVTLDYTTMDSNDFYVLSGTSAGIPSVSISGMNAMRAGNANFDRRIKYDGVNNDRQIQGSQVLSHSGNSGNVLNYAGAEGYFSGDINMDGKVLYDGANNDRQIILNIVVTYPMNTGTLANYNDLVEQIP